MLLLKINGISLHDGSREGVVFTFFPVHWCLHCRSVLWLSLRGFEISPWIFEFHWLLLLTGHRLCPWKCLSHSELGLEQQQPAVCCHGKLFCVTVLAAQPASTPGLILQQYLSTWTMRMVSRSTIGALLLLCFHISCSYYNIYLRMRYRVPGTGRTMASVMHYWGGRPRHIAWAGS